jgi:hypothetical protein
VNVFRSRFLVLRIEKATMVGCQASRLNPSGVPPKVGSRK